MIKTLIILGILGGAAYYFYNKNKAKIQAAQQDASALKSTVSSLW